MKEHTSRRSLFTPYWPNFAPYKSNFAPYLEAQVTSSLRKNEAKQRKSKNRREEHHAKHLVIDITILILNASVFFVPLFFLFKSVCLWYF